MRINPKWHIGKPSRVLSGAKRIPSAPARTVIGKVPFEEQFTSPSRNNIAPAPVMAGRFTMGAEMSAKVPAKCSDEGVSRSGAEVLNEMPQARRRFCQARPLALLASA